MAKLSQSKAPKDHEAKNSTTTVTTATTAATATATATGKKKKRTRRSVPRETPTQRSSIYRGVTRHRWTGRYEAHLWDKNCWNESQNKKGKQVYLGAYDDEEMAARAYDLAALKYWGPETILNFPVSNYEKELKEMEGQSREEYIGSLRRKSNGFSRGVSKYRGVARHHHNGRWEARIGRVFGNKYLYLGTYATQEEAATAYDMAAIEYRGLNAVTNFDLSRYIRWLKPNNQTNNDTNTTEADDHANPNPNPNLTPEATTSTSSANIDLYTPNLDFLSSLENSQQFMATNNGCSDTTIAQHGPKNATSSALGLLLQSSKFKEMMEMTSSTVAEEATSFPEDVQTYFDYFQGPSSSNFEDSDNDNFFSEFISSLETPPMI